MKDIVFKESLLGIESKVHVSWAGIQLTSQGWHLPCYSIGLSFAQIYRWDNSYHAIFVCELILLYIQILYAFTPSNNNTLAKERL